MKLLKLYALFIFILCSSDKPTVKEDADMVLVQGGTFTMGCAPDLKETCGLNLKPPQQVTLNSFKMSKYLVTVARFEAFIKATKYQTDAEKKGSSSVWNGKEWINGWGINWSHNVTGKPYAEDEKKKFPVINVSYNDAQEYCRWLSDKTGKHYRLPTEAEWEYAARGGNKSRGYRYAGSDTIAKVAWYALNSGGTTHPVGLKQPNELGLYDMTGNVWEWCNDWFGRDFKTTPVQNPQGPLSGTSRALHGASWRNADDYSRPSVSVGDAPDYRGNFIGFRLVEDL
jgi:sulfatase modifying factor 1